MSTNKYKWLTLSLASIFISGCAVGGKPHLNLGIADAFRKSKSCLFKKKLSYGAPAVNTSFGYAEPVNTVAAPCVNCAAAPSNVSVIHDQSAPCDCSCNGGVCAPATEFQTPAASPMQEVVEPTTEPVSSNSLPVTALPFEESDDSLELENPLPAPVEVPDTLTAPAIPAVDLDPTEEEGIIETLDSASVAPDKAEEVLDEIDEDLNITPKKDETSILDTAAKPLETKTLEAKTPTSAGRSVVEQRSKMLTLHARPVQSHQASSVQSAQKKVEMQQVTHKRHFREQNSLRPVRQNRNVGSKPLERTAEIPAPVKFKPLPVLSKESPTGKTSDANTGAPSLNSGPISETLEQSTKMQRLTSPVEVIESETEKESGIKIARLPLLKAESTSSAAIGSLRNFTNVRDLDPGFDKDYYSRKKAEAAAKAAEVIEDTVSELSDDLSIER